MKKSFLMLALLGGTATAAQAQSAISAGTISLGGGIGYGSNTTNSEYKSTSGGTSNTYTTEKTDGTFGLSAMAGYFVADNIAVGLSLGYTAAGSKTTLTGPGTSSPSSLDATTTFRVGPYAQYYAMLSDQFGFVGTLGAGYQNSFQPFKSGSGSTATVVERKGSGYYAGLTPSVIFFPIPKFAISASVGNLGYDKMTLKDSNDADGDAASRSSVGANFGLDQLMFSGTFFLGR